MRRIHPVVAPDFSTLSRVVAERVVAAIAGTSGAFTMALSGGETPQMLYRMLAGDEYRDVIPWRRMHLFWGDERYVPRDDEASNYRMAREALIDRVPIPASNVHPVPTEFNDPAEGARAYEATLRRFFGDAGATFDLALMGMGADGHTASLFPGGAELNERTRFVTPSRAPVEPRERLTLTFPIFNRARRLFVLAVGEKKRPIVQAIMDDPEFARSAYPAAMFEPEGELIWFVDRAAVGGR